MKSHLTDNGVLTLYNLNIQAPTKVQVIYLSQWNMVTFVRVADSIHLSPIMVVTKMNEKFIVGDVIQVKRVQLRSSDFLKDERLLSILDYDISHIIIVDYQVIEKKANLNIFNNFPNYNGESSYWNSLLLIKNNLMKIDSSAEAFFHRTEKRLELLRTDCNLLREMGNELFKTQNFSKAILHYDMAKQKDCYDARVWNNSSQAYYFNNEYERAKRDALIALKLDPFNKKAYFRAGRAMEKAGDVSGAFEVIEAGLYVCGKCDDLEKLHRQIKDSLKINGNKNNKKDENLKNNLNNSKKKILNEESNQNSFAVSSLSNGHAKKHLKPKENSHNNNNNNNVNNRKYKENYSKQDSKTENVHDSKKKAIPMLSFLVGAKMLYEKGKFKNALELYEVAESNMFGKTNLKDNVVLYYLMDVCRFKSKSKSTEVVKSSFLSALPTGVFPFRPALHYWLALMYKEHEDQDKVDFHANSCIQLLENNSKEYKLFWPGTNELISETSPEQLKIWFNEGSWRSAPLAKCRHLDCISIQNHSLAKTEIYASDLDFRGYVEVECEEMCCICYHPGCWKATKENTEEGQLARKADKDFMGLSCFTPDCAGKIINIRIFDETKKLRNQIAKDKKDKNNQQTSKPKKKKDRKRTTKQNTKLEDKKMRKNECFGFKEEDEVQIVKEETVIKKIISEHSEPVNFEGNNNYRVLKPNNDDDDEFLTHLTTKKNKTKKKKKNKQVTQISLGDDQYDRFFNNEYLSRLRDLRAQRDALDSDTDSHSFLANGEFRYLPECVLDPDRPFYLPRHLQDNPSELESVLRAKMVTTSSSDIDKNSIANLLEFMYDWLKAHSPMLMTDSRLTACVSDNFPQNAIVYVNKCGGIRHFLLQSFKFALVDQIVCVSEQVVSAQEMAIQLVLDKFKMGKYLISDCYKAHKFSHLLTDDTKSTCSSASSLSTLLSVGPQQSPLDSSPPKINGTVISNTPCKNAALSQIYPNVAEIKSDSIVPNLKVSIQKLDETPRKNKLKTMDIDAFEVIDPSEMGNLFAASPPDSDKTYKSSGAASNTKQEVVLDSENDIKINNELNMEMMKERLSTLESELSSKDEAVAALNAEKDRLSAQNQELNDRFSQIKTKSCVEIAALKKNAEDADERSKASESAFQSYKSQREGELRKMVVEKARFQDDLKARSAKVEALQFTVDQLNTAKTQHEQEIEQKSIQLTEQAMELMNVRDLFEASEARAKEAETKYLTTKRDLIKTQLEKTKKRLTAEVNKMRQLLAEATPETQPTRATLAHSVTEWDEVIAKINNNIQTNREDGQKLLSYIALGRSLNSLPPGDLQVPSTPDLTIAHLLYIGKSAVHPSFKSAPGNIPPLLRMNSNPFSKGTAPTIGSLASGGTLSFGQLGVPPSISAAGDRRNKVNSPLLPLPMSNGVMNRNSILGSGNGHLGNLPFGLGLNSASMQRPPSSSNINSPSSSSGFCSSNGVAPSLSNIIGNKDLSKIASSLTNHVGGENISKNGSSNSSPTQGLLPTPLSSQPDDFNSIYSMESKYVNDNENQLFVGQLPWSCTEDQLKAMFAKYDVASVAIHNNTMNADFRGRSASRCGYVTFRTQFERDRAMRAGPVTFAGQTFHVQTKEVKRIEKPSLLGQGPSDLSLIPSSSPIPSMQKPSLLGQGPSDLSLIPSSSPIPSMSGITNTNPSCSSVTAVGQQTSEGSASSAFGLQSLLDASKRAEVARRSLSTPTSAAITKPKFQNLRSTNTIGAIGTLPPKVVRPIARGGAANSLQNLQSMNNDDAMTASNAYKRLIEECKQKFGNEYSLQLISKAIKEVREQNKKSLSGLQLETILERVEGQLQLCKKLPPKPSVAPWAQLTQVEPPLTSAGGWGGPVRTLDAIGDDHCAICLDALSASATMPLPCQHAFHIKCIKNWLVRKSDCPICRKFALNSDEYPSLSH